MRKMTRTIHHLYIGVLRQPPLQHQYKFRWRDCLENLGPVQGKAVLQCHMCMCVGLQALAMAVLRRPVLCGAVVLIALQTVSRILQPQKREQDISHGNRAEHPDGCMSLHLNRYTEQNTENESGLFQSSHSIIVTCIVQYRHRPRCLITPLIIETSCLLCYVITGPLYAPR